MKKLKTLVSILLIAALLAGCGLQGETVVSSVIESVQEEAESETKSNATIVDNRSKSTSDDEDNDESEQPEAEIPTFTADDFETVGYLYETMFGDSMYFLAVTNNSKAAVEVSANAIAKDSDGNMIGAGDMSIDILGAGETSIGYFYFSSVSGIDSIEYELTYDISTWYQPVLNDLDIQQTLNDGNVTVAVTNNGNVNAQFVEAYAIFLDADDNVISYSSTYLTDNDSEIKPGRTISGQLDCYETFDHVVVYYAGRSDGSAPDYSQYVSGDNFDVEEYFYDTGYGATMLFMAVTNNSEEIVSVSGNATALDANGNSIGAADMSIDILGPGEQSLGYFYFDDVTGISDISYELDYSTDVYYDPVIANLEIMQTINNSNVILNVTNTGDYAAEFVEAYALFFDANGNVVYHDSTYLTDDESEIKPGKSIAGQLNTYEAFDTVKVFFTGRHSQW